MITTSSAIALIVPLITRDFGVHERLLALIVLGITTTAVLAWHVGRRRLRAATTVTRDHEELQALNARIKHAAQEWRTTVDTLDAALLVMEPDGTVLRMNLAAAGTLPGGFVDWLGRPSSELSEHQPWALAFDLAATAIARRALATARSRTTDGRTWDLSCRVLPNRQPPAVLVLARDVTEVVELQESAKRTDTMAALGSIVVGVAHEVRNPLFAISSLVDAWALQPYRDPGPFVDALRSEVSRLRTLMLELLEYGRPESSTLRSEEIATVIDNAVRSCTHEAAARGIRIVNMNCAGGVVLMDLRRLERVFINLLQNAVLHAPHGSDVQIEIRRTAPDEPALAVAIRDHGPGFAPADLARVFSPFFSRRPGGFGLGLAIAERIVNEHHGRIAAANDAAGGAVVTVWLPLVAEPAESFIEDEAPCSRAGY